MYLFLQFFRQSIKTELTGTFYQYNLILQPQFSTGNSAQQGFCIRIESLLDVKACGTRRYLTAYSDDTLTASYGMRIHPFYRTLQSHQGVDYTVPEGSRVFATADGRVKEIATRSTAGRTIVIDHGNGYETSYSHLLAVNVRRGQEVRRGDIIGLSGNTGLSIAPHLHYEVRHNGMRVDPIHYFFMELSPVEYQRIIRIAQSGMQSFD